MRKLLITCCIVLIVLMRGNAQTYFPVGSTSGASGPGTASWDLTPASGALCHNQVGALWCDQRLDFTKPFIISYKAKFGIETVTPADGLCVVFGEHLTVATLPVGTGGSIGYYGSGSTTYNTNSFAIEYDTYNNGGVTCDIPTNHIAIARNSNFCLQTAAPTTISGGSIVDNNYHEYRITWDPALNLLKVYLDCSLMKSSIYDYRTVFSSTAAATSVQWGFTSSTGGACGHHLVKDVSIALPGVTTVNHTVCADELPLSLTAPTGLSYIWSTGSTAGTISVISNGSYYISVFSTCGDFYTVRHNVTVNPLPLAPTIVETTGNRCVGSAVNFRVTGQVGMVIHYQTLPSVSPGISTSVIPSSGSVNFPRSAVAPWTWIHIFKIVNPATGCELLVDDWDSLCIAPIPNAGDIAGDKRLCAGTTKPYTKSGDPEGVWSVSPASIGIIDSYFGTFTPHPWSSGTATISYTYTNCCGTDIATYVVTVDPLGSAVATYTGCTPPDPGTTLTFLITGTPGATVNYSWTDPSAMFSPVYASTVLPTPVGTVSVTIPPPYPSGVEGIFVFSIDDVTLNGCVNSLGTAIPVELKWPTAYIGNSLKFCQGNCGSFEVYGTPGATVKISQISPPGPTTTVTLGSTGVTSGWALTPLLCPTVTTSYQITSVQRCGGAHAVLGPIETVTVVPTPAVSLFSNSPVCESTPLILTASCPACTNPYYWQGPDISLPTTTPLTLPATTYTIPWADLFHSGTYSVTGSYYDIQSGLTCSATATTVVSVNPAPTATISCSGSACAGPSSTIVLNFIGTPDATVTYNSIPSGYSGSVPLNSVGTGSVAVTILSASGPLMFVIADVVSSGPDSCHMHSSPPPCTVYVNEKPPCPAYYNSATDEIVLTGWVPGATITFLYWDPGMPGLTTYTYSLSPSTFPRFPTFPGSASTIHTTSFFDGSCTWTWGTDDCEIELPGLAKPAIGESNDGTWRGSVSLKPNPNRGVFTISGAIGDYSDDVSVVVEVSDILGKVLYTNVVNVKSGILNTTINLEKNLSYGVHFVKIKNHHFTKVLRFTLE